MKPARVIRRDSSIFIPLPPEARRDIPGGCCCTWCTAHPDCVPQWDTIAIADKAPRNGRDEYTATVHYPAACEDHKKKTTPTPSGIVGKNYRQMTADEWDAFMRDLPELTLTDATDQD